MLQFGVITINKNDDIIKIHEYSIEKPGSERRCRAVFMMVFDNPTGKSRAHRKFVLLSA